MMYKSTASSMESLPLPAVPSALVSLQDMKLAKTDGLDLSFLTTFAGGW
jgi:hypothetical protein